MIGYSGTWAKAQVFFFACWAWLNRPLTFNFLRKRGYITEGYNPESDAYEVTFDTGLPGLRFTRVKHRFSACGIGRIAAKHDKIIVARPGVTATFSSHADLARRMSALASHPGYRQAPDVPFIVYNKNMQRYSLLPPERIEFAKQTQKPVRGLELMHERAAIAA